MKRIEYTTKEQLEALRKADREYQRKKRAKDPNKKIEEIQEYRKKNPEKIKAHNKVNNSIKRGILKKLKCRDCERLDTHAHHQDYSKPLEVTWLCPSHHKLEHSKKSI